MDKVQIFHLLTNSGLKVFDIDNRFVYFEDPACIFPAFDAVLNYAWMLVMVLLGIMLFGWGVLYIKNGIKLDTVFHNAKSLILILAVLAAVKPIVDLVYGENLFSQQCEIKKVELDEVQSLTDMRKKRFGKYDEYTLYENFNVIDSGAVSSLSDEIGLYDSDEEDDEEDETEE